MGRDLSEYADGAGVHPVAERLGISSQASESNSNRGRSRKLAALRTASVIGGLPFMRSDVPVYIFGKGRLQGLARGARVPHCFVAELWDRQQIPRRGSNEHLVGALQIGQCQRALDHPNSRRAYFLEQQFPRNPRQASRTERGCPHLTTLGGKDVRRGA